MKNGYRNVTIRVDGYTRVCLTAIAVLLTVLIVGLWANHSPTPDAAFAGGVPRAINPQSQRDAVAEAQRAGNAKLDELIELLKSGDVQVKVIGQLPAEEDADRADVQAK